MRQLRIARRGSFRRSTNPSWTQFLIALIILLSGSDAPADLLPADQVPISIIQALADTSVVSAFEASERDTYDYAINSGERTGIFLTTQILPVAAHLIISRKDSSEIEHCSGITISATFVLTAAHCLCTRGTKSFKDAAECIPELHDIRIQLFLPGRGIFDASGAIHIHPNYRTPLTATRSERIADIALIQFRGNFPVTAVEIGKLEGRFLSSGFGMLSFTLENDIVSGFKSNTGYQAGAQQTHRVKQISKGWDQCGPIGASDTYCSTYNSIVETAGEMQDATVCGGDSGSPIFQYDLSRMILVLVGITSYYSPAAANKLCKGDAESRRTHYMDLGVFDYKTWIESHATPRPADTDAAFSRPSCASAVFSPGEFALTSFKGLITGTVVDEYALGRPGITIEVESESENCRAIRSAGIFACELRVPQDFSVSFDRGFAQLTLCTP